MPFGDGTGPIGRIRGCGLGPCGRGFRRGFGARRGFCRGNENYQEDLNLTKEEQVKILEAQKQEMELEIKRINEKIKELENAKT